METACQQAKVDAILLVAALFDTKEALEHKDWLFGLISLNNDQSTWSNQKYIHCLIKRLKFNKLNVLDKLEWLLRKEKKKIGQKTMNFFNFTQYNSAYTLPLPSPSHPSPPSRFHSIHNFKKAKEKQHRTTEKTNKHILVARLYACCQCTYWFAASKCFLLFDFFFNVSFLKVEYLHAFY